MTVTKSPWVIEVRDDDFNDNVIKRSHNILVVVDFWAEWCGPCRSLGPTLEKLAEEWNGAFLLAKVNVETSPNVAQQFHIQSIPVVKSFRDGAPGAEFTGALPESAVRQFLRGLVPSEAEVLVAQAQSLAASDSDETEALLRKALALEPNSQKAMVELAETLLSRDETDEVKQLLDQLIPGGDLGSRVERLRASIFFREQLTTESEEELNARVHKNPEDADALLHLGRFHAVQGRYKDALERLLQAGQANQNLAAKQVKELMVKIFFLVGERSTLSDDYRSKLSKLLY